MKFVLEIEQGVSVLLEAESLEEAKEQYEGLFKKTLKIKANPESSGGLLGHLLRLKDEGFFSQPKSLSETKEKLKELALHYPSTTFPPYLNRLVRDRILRRFQGDKEGKKVWVYVNN